MDLMFLDFLKVLGMGTRFCFLTRKDLCILTDPIRLVIIIGLEIILNRNSIINIQTMIKQTKN